MRDERINSLKETFMEEIKKQQADHEQMNLLRRKRFEQYIEFSKEVDGVTVINKDEGTLTRENILTEGIYKYRGIEILVENGRLYGFKIVGDKRVNLFSITINPKMDTLQLYRIVGDLIHNLFRRGEN